MKKLYIIIIIMCVSVICAGCGKEEAPASASTTTYVTTTQPQPTESVTPTQEVHVINVAEEYHRDFEVLCELPQSTREYLNKLEETNILPFLGEYKIKKVSVDVNGNIVLDHIEYVLNYECRKGDIVLYFTFRTSEITHDVSKVTDGIRYDKLIIEKYGEVIAEYNGEKGLAKHTK